MKQSRGSVQRSVKGLRMWSLPEKLHWEEGPSSSSGGSKRKAGEEGVQDIDDLVRETEDPMEEQLEKIQALAARVGSTEATKVLIEIGAFRGVRKTRHIQARFPWLRDEIFEKKLVVKKINGKTDDADLTTKVHTKAVLKDHLKRMGYETTGRSGHKKLA